MNNDRHLRGISVSARDTGSSVEIVFLYEPDIF
jgi:hypothetical protein